MVLTVRREVLVFTVVLCTAFVGEGRAYRGPSKSQVWLQWTGLSKCISRFWRCFLVSLCRSRSWDLNWACNAAVSSNADDSTEAVAFLLQKGPTPLPVLGPETHNNTSTLRNFKRHFRNWIRSVTAEKSGRYYFLFHTAVGNFWRHRRFYFRFLSSSSLSSLNMSLVLSTWQWLFSSCDLLLLRTPDSCNKILIPRSFAWFVCPTKWPTERNQGELNVFCTDEYVYRIPHHICNLSTPR